MNTAITNVRESAAAIFGSSSTRAVGLVSLLMPWAAQAEWKLNMQTPNSAIAAEMFDVHTLITTICVVIFFLVFGVMFYSLYAHRKSKGHKAAQFHESATVEVIWTIVPFFILLAMAFPATKAVLHMRDTSAPEMTVKVTAYQWKWGYDYINEGFGFLSNLSTPLAQIKNNEAKGENYLLEVDNPLVVPVGKKIRLLLTANDVIHAWWVPVLGVKQDAIPGFIRDAWFRADRPGIYRGNCAELCGKEHGYMPVVVEVKTQADYDKWVVAQKDKYGVGKAAAVVVDTKTYSREELVAHGKTVYEGLGGCQGCHQPTGKGVSGQFPALDGSKVVNGPKDGQVALLLNGKAGTAMASFKHLSDKDLAGVMAYTRSTWSNKVSEFAQPLDFAKARNGGVLPAGTATAAAAPAAAPAEAAPAPAAAGSALAEKIYFAVGKKDLPAEAKESISAALAFLKGKDAAKVDITGFTDKTGDPAANLELAKERAKAVRAALEAAGVSKDRINMKPPAEVTGSADNKAARRVEINAGA